MGAGNSCQSTDGKLVDQGVTGEKLSAPLQTLQNMDRIEVKQRMSKMELLTCDCFESKNKYDVFDGNGKKVFYAHETTGCCMRQFQNLFPDCAPWDVTIDFKGGGMFGGGSYQMKKDCTYCTFLCFNRPVTYVTDEAGNALGSIRDPCACIPTNMTFTIMDPNGTDVIRAESGCCQWGICCPMPCGPCKSVDFPLVDVQSGRNVGNMKKKMKGCFKMMCLSCCFDDVENYKIDFSGVEDPRQKALIMALAIFTDFRYFHNTADDEIPIE